MKTMSNIENNARRMIRLLEQMRHRRPSPVFDQLKQLNLSFSHLRAMGHLTPDRVLSMKDLADELQMTPPSVTALTRRLVQTGMIQRTTHAEDSRVALLALTEAGRNLHQQLAQEHVEQMAELLQGLTPQEQEQFLDLLARAVQALQTGDQHSESAATPDAHAAGATDNHSFPVVKQSEDT